MNTLKSITTIFPTIIFALALMFMLDTQAALANDSKEIILTLDGDALQSEQTPVLVDDRVMVQIRTIAEALGADIDWDPSSQKISIVKAPDNIELTIDSKTAIVNDEYMELDVAPFIGSGNSTMVPLRFVSEAFGLSVSWNDNTVALVSGAEGNEVSEDKEVTADQENPETPSNSFSSDDLFLNIEGKDWGLMENAEALIEIMGSEVECFESISCAYDGMDRLYSNEDFSVSVLPINGEESQIIDEILLTSPKYSTSKGIKVGSPMQDIIDAYGTNYTDQYGTIIYWAGEENALKTPRLYFEIQDEKVTALGIFGARNAG